MIWQQQSWYRLITTRTSSGRNNFVQHTLYEVIRNTKEIIAEIKKANALGISIVTTPELSLTGYTCADLFSQDVLIEESYESIDKILNETKELDIISIIGAPIRTENQLFNCAVIIQNGNILGVIPKTYIPNYSEFYEKRWFASSINRNNFVQHTLYEVIRIGFSSTSSTPST